MNVNVIVRHGEYRISGMSRALRHAPADYGIVLNDDGTVLVSTLAGAFNVSVSDVLQVVETDAKGRYEVFEDERGLLIRAVHGHTVPVVFDMRIVDNPGTLFHGTKESFLSNILESGVHSGDRNFVHVSSDYSIAVSVADRRRGETVVLLIDGSALVDSGRTVFLSASGVFLVDQIPAEFITEIVYV